MGFREFILLLWVSIMLSMVCVSIGQTPYVPIDNYLIDCGSSSNTIVGDRVFVLDDSGSRDLSTPENILATTTINSISAPLGSRIYQTARVYTGDTTYTFPIQRQGRHWIRLHFFPFVYRGYNMTSATFSVAAQQFTLLHDFRPRNSSVVEEFSLNVTTNSLVLSFRPQTGSIAFLNALEVVSVPDELIMDDAQSINPNGNFRGLWRQALKTVYRVNMGGPLVSPQNDTLGRTWTSDQAFLRSGNLVKPVSNVGGVKYQDGGATDRIAPITVYGTAASMQTADVPNSNFNITWEFDVESGSDYLVRYHFCDIVSTSLHELYFNVYLASQAVLRDLDLSEKTTQSLATPYYRDFIVKTSGMTKLSVSVGPSTGVPNALPNAILNGLEVMKMNNTEGSLDAGVVANSGKKKSKMAVGVIAGVVAGLFVLIAVAIIIFMLCRRRQRSKQSKTWVPFMMNGGNSQSTGGKVPHGTVGTTASNGGYHIPFVILQDATNNFNESWVIGVGGFGKVYKGVLKDGTRIAVKRGNPQSQQGLAEFQTEIEMLSKLRHRHLVSMIGYCDEGSEMILIYEFMENGTLKSHLYGSEFPSMDWKQRLEICVGSARGLHYLHTGSAKAIIHRDVKSANILLDENLMAKVADFGLSKAGPDIDQTHVSTAVKGSFGYLDPEYFRRQQLTEKSDVYSFGVVLFEVLCARPVIDPSLPREMVNLGEWVMKYQRSGKLEQIIDPNLVDKVNPDSLRKFGETAEKCLAEYGVDRPSMADVLWNLEYALQLQEASNQSEPCENSTNQIGDISPLVNNGSFVGTSAPAEQFSSIEDLSGTSMSRVFSQLVKAEGR